ncbi:MAG: redoxin domain-containing protein [Chitinophagaceae bacterium]|nr:redoxin domain-containing protein [Chitinophagaceae bacterium]
MKLSFLGLLLLQILLSRSLTGQSNQNQKNYPETGALCPDFVLSDIRNFKFKQASLKDFKGKWLLLDFWSKGCSGCITQFPKLNAINEKHKDVLQVLLVGQNSVRYNKDIDMLFEKIREKQQLNLPIAYDSVLFEQFGIMGVPGVIILDPDGIVKAVTYGVTPEKISALLGGRPVYFEHKPNIYEVRELDSVKINSDGPTNNSEDILVGSYLSKWKSKTQRRSIVLSVENNLSEGYFNVIGASLIDLYKYAYVGRCIWWNNDSLNYTLSQHPVFEFSDKDLFEIDYDTGEGGYNYYLRIPADKASLSNFQQIMKQDLTQLFGYEVSFEKREVPCFRLTASEDARKKLVTRNGQVKYYQDFATLQLENVPVKSLIGFIQSNTSQDYPVIDNTGITSNIDISLEVMLTDLDDVKKQLGKKGLKLEKGSIMMMAMVFRKGK